ncbi:hypothetical protein EYF80_004330 [Liparis tanakae]|uniref:Uncharacterized protein n=1 Tax=Liparis tanakae TaxID=230148 RepID=A0A4Z2J6N1_9TELE|nr:hypothetical protein EYF80_004330 [Liparis tanakae]
MWISAKPKDSRPFEWLHTDALERNAIPLEAAALVGSAELYTRAPRGSGSVKAMGSGTSLFSVSPSGLSKSPKSSSPVCSQILLPAGAAEEVEGEVGATLPFEPDVHVGPGAVVALARRALTAAWIKAVTDLPFEKKSSDSGLSAAASLEEACSS